jgi:hypothetical protein
MSLSPRRFTGRPYTETVSESDGRINRGTGYDPGMDARTVGLGIVVLGVAAVVVGLAVYLGWLSWFGHLPGDLRIEREGMRVYVPITSMIVASIVLTLAVNLVRRLF